MSLGSVRKSLNPKKPPNEWNVQASSASLNTSNPIREIIESMNLAENPSKKTIPLSIGDPTIFGNLKPCKEILDALNKANSSGRYYGYQTAAGMESAREAVANYHYRNTGNIVKAQDVILASGCSHAIDLCICVLAHQGQNILIPQPGFPLYKTLTSVYGIKYKQYNLIADKNWSIDLRHLESLIDENTAAIIVNNPSNPCGSVFSRKHLLQILEIAERYKIPIIADEIYDKLVFSAELYRRYPYPPPNSYGTHQQNPYNSSQNTHSGSILLNNFQPPPSFHHCYDHLSARQTNKTNGKSTPSDESCMDSENQQPCKPSEIEILSVNIDSGPEETSDSSEMTPSQQPIDGYTPFIALSSLSKTVPILTCGGISKTCLIPGLRLGWIIINDRQGIFDASVRTGLNRLTQRLMGPNSLVQGALTDILMNVPESFYLNTMDFIFRNARLCFNRLQQVPGLQPYMPQGSMYLMVRFDTKSFPTINGDLDFTSKLMNEESVLVLPGRCFDFPNFFRICLTVPTNVMEEALDRMSDFCARYHIDRRPARGYESFSVLSKAFREYQLVLKGDEKSIEIPSVSQTVGGPRDMD